MRLLMTLVFPAVLLLASAAQAVTLTSIKLTAPDGVPGDEFGFSVGISGNIAIVGAPSPPSRVPGGDGGNPAAYLFDARSGSLLHKLTAPDGEPGDEFGFSVGISGNTAIVGAWLDGGGGSAYLFDTATGGLLHKLTAPDGAGADWFGSSVGISGGTAIVGAFGDDPDGSAYLFDVVTGSLRHKLTAPSGAGVGSFGRSVGIDGSTAIVGAGTGGGAFLFDAVNGSLLRELPGPAGFGRTAAIAGNTAVVAKNDSGVNPVLLLDTTTGGMLHELTSGVSNDDFGRSVGMSGNTAIVGTKGGAAYLFDTATGGLLHQLTGSASDYFGTAVGISGSTAIVGAWGDDGNGIDSGAAYLFAPVPAPAGIWLLAPPLLGLLALSRKRRT